MADTNIEKVDVWGTYEKYVSEQKSKTNALGQDAFLKILTAQLKYQDPMEPQKDADFIAQLAQFSSLEQMTQLNNAISASSAYNLTGKMVHATAQLVEGGPMEEIFGRVDAVTIVDGAPYVQVNGHMVKASDVTSVLDSQLFGSGDLASNANLVGKAVSGKYFDSAGSEQTIQGLVERIFYKSGMIYAQISQNGQTHNVALADIDQIADSVGQLAAAAATETENTDANPDDSADTGSEPEAPTEP